MLIKIKSKIARNIGILLFSSICLLSFFSCNKTDLIPIADDETLSVISNDYFEAVSDTDPTYWKKANTHDPSIIHAKDGYYYVYSTDAQKGTLLQKRVQVRRSKDMITWEYVGIALQSIPEESVKLNGADYVWAPQVIYLHGKYYMYYCTTAFGRKLSYIGLAISDKPEGPFIPEGKILTCVQKDPVNVIDPNVMFDAEGKLWMVYGSFFGGIYILPLDKKTGLRPKGDSGWGTKIAGGSHTPFEGPCIVLKDDYYYLFLSTGDLNTDYCIHVARCPVSSGITGPYLDYEGKDVNDALPNTCRTIGNKILGSFAITNERGIRAPGGQHVFKDGEKFYMVHHTRTTFKESYFFYLNVREVYFNEDSWPVVNPNEFTGNYNSVNKTINNESLVGSWELVQSVRSNRKGAFKNYEKRRYNGIFVSDAVETLSKTCTFIEGGIVETPYGIGTWELKDNNVSIFLTSDEDDKTISYKGIVTYAYDVMSNKKVLSISTMGSNGEYLFGNKY